MNRKIVNALIGAAAATATLVGTAGSAHADAPPTGAEACPSGSFCLYYNSPNAGWGSFEHWSPATARNLGPAATDRAAAPLPLSQVRPDRHETAPDRFLSQRSATVAGWS
ncbi:hypothetical protein [Kitasatospora kifunensis]|uniref:Peptidase inhibitor family I36 n=1 Tax=Kitasatospora kifunensis TaxID=58351 RepID=A0A7W7VSS4_KITKI|nr:hypothetical protein [Kitasatospora kifunensis]MBB4921462.1 hypothetical protein [Kitasatospora kifunensis]